MKKNIETLLDNQLQLEHRIEYIINDACYADRFLSKPSNNRCPSMYQLLETHYDPKDWGYHVENKFKLRATPRQMTRYDLAIELLALVDDEVYKDPILARKLLWLRGNKFKWTKLGRMFGFHRTTIKNMYQTILQSLAHKVKIKFDRYDKIFI